MPNPLTGDFEAVLQVSGATVNRLLASMHQHAPGSDLPTFPHSIGIRVGDPDPIDGMRGSIYGQVSAPRIELIHGVSDKFWIEVDVRARYKPDAGSVPVPEFINGIVRAQYRMDMVDPNCFGWEKVTGEYLWIRVVRDTVSFTGTAVDDASIIAVAQNPVDPSTADARITELAKHLLSKRFQATPHKVSRRFRRGSMRSLNSGLNESCVAVPIGLFGDPSAGNIDSIDQDFLDKRDVGIGISRDVIVKKIQEALDAATSAFREKFQFYHQSGFDFGPWGDVPVLTVTIDWTVTLNKGSVEWIGGIPLIMGFSVPGGLVSISLTGQARTQKKVFNFDFKATQTMLITFDGSTEEFGAVPFGNATVNLFGAFAPVVESKARPEMQKSIADALKNAAKGMGDELSLADRKTDLIDQLKTMDDKADVDFTSAVFTPDGVVVLGNIILSPRLKPDIKFGFTLAKDGYSAFESWIPGGRIDSFNWSWKWFNNGGKPGAESIDDRFILLRPQASGQGRFGLVLGVNRPLPGLDGMGQVCLVASGTRINSVTGQMNAVTVSRRCKKFGFDLSVATPDRLFLREWKPGPRDPIGPVAEIAIHEVSGQPSIGNATNTLVVRAGNGWNHEAAKSLRDGLADSTRRDAGLVVLLLFRDRQLMEGNSNMMEELQALARDLEAPLVVNEDVESSWSRALRLSDEESLEWRLLSPTGGVTWARSGSLNPKTLATALDDYLIRSPGASVAHVTHGLPYGTKISSGIFETDVIGRLARRDDPCPPPPFARLGIESAVTFVKKNSYSSDAAVHAMSADDDETGAMKIVVLDGGNAEDGARMSDAMPGVMIVPDPDGKISRRFGIRSWPASVRIGANGAVSESEVRNDE